MENYFLHSGNLKLGMLELHANNIPSLGCPIQGQGQLETTKDKGVLVLAKVYCKEGSSDRILIRILLH